jgi:hypothetical protein
VVAVVAVNMIIIIIVVVVVVLIIIIVIVVTLTVVTATVVDTTFVAAIVTVVMNVAVTIIIIIIIVSIAITHLFFSSNTHCSYLKALPNFQHAQLFLERRYLIHTTMITNLLDEITQQQVLLNEQFKQKRERILKDLAEAKLKQRKIR